LASIDIDFSSIKLLHKSENTVIFKVMHRELGEIIVKTSPCLYRMILKLMDHVKRGGDRIDRTFFTYCSEDEARRIIEEADILKKLGKHEYIAEYFAGTFAGVPAIVAKYYPENLRDIVEVYNKRFLHREAIKLLIKIGRALSYIHKQGFVHGDVKPSNILIDSSGEPKLSDFSAAVYIGRGEYAKAKGFTIGFSAPEQIEEGLVYYTSDVYALASLYIYMTTGKPPSEIQLSEIKLPRIIRNALTRDPRKRPSINMFLSLLEDLIVKKEFYLEGSGKVFKLEPSKRTYTIGRDRSCDITINNEYISRYHCELIYDEIENTWKIRDNNSLNGTVIKRNNNEIIVFIGRRSSQSGYYHELANKLGVGVIEEYLQNDDEILLAYSFKTRKAQVTFRYREKRSSKQ